MLLKSKYEKQSCKWKNKDFENSGTGEEVFLCLQFYEGLSNGNIFVIPLQ